MLKISGHSDDVVSIEGDIEDEVKERQRITVGTPEMGGVIVTMRYGVGGTAVWQASIRQLDEKVVVIWPVRVVTAENGYSVAVEVECPLGTPVMCGKIRWLTGEGRVKN